MVASERMVGAGDGILDVASHGVDSVERGDLRAGPATTGGDALIGLVPG